MNKLIILVVLACVLGSLAQSSTDKRSQSEVTYGPAFDEVVVQSNLNVRKKPAVIRTARNVYFVAPEGRLYRAKRQFGGGFQNPAFNNNYGSSSALANAASQGQHFGPNGFGAGAANAQAQAFQAQGPLGGFGAAAANTQSQNFNAGPGGISGGAALGGSQSYNLPNGQTINLAYTNGFTVGEDGKVASANSNSLAFN